MIDYLVKREQISSGGGFITGIPIEDYLDKIKEKAEIISHFREGECVGFVAFYCNDPMKKNAFITLVLVAPEFRGRGISQALINYALDVCKVRKFEICSLEVVGENIPAVKAYEKIGFIKAGQNKGKIMMKIALN